MGANGLEVAVTAVTHLAETLSVEVGKVVGANRAGVRQTEYASARQSASGGGVARARLHDALNQDLVICSGGLTLYIRGVADALGAGVIRGNEINTAVITNDLRPIVELAATMAWLLDAEIDGVTRARRYLSWRLEDLDAMAHLLDKLPKAQEAADHKSAVQKQRTGLAELASKAKWATKTSQTGAVYLTKSNGKGEPVPSREDRVAALAGTVPSLYTILSTSSHVERHGLFRGLKADASVSGVQTAKLSGFGLGVPAALMVVVSAVHASARRHLEWSGHGTQIVDAALQAVVDIASQITHHAKK